MVGLRAVHSDSRKPSVSEVHTLWYSGYKVYILWKPHVKTMQHHAILHANLPSVRFSCGLAQARNRGCGPLNRPPEPKLCL